MFRIGATARIICVAVLLMAAGPRSLAAQPDASRNPDFEIPAQSLARALQLFAHQAGLQILFTGKSVEARRSPRLSGRMTADHALNALLAGTDLEHVYLGDVVIVRPKLPPPSAVESGGAPQQD